MLFLVSYLVMGESDGVFVDLYRRGRDYFTENIARIILFFSICIVIVFIFFAALIPSKMILAIMILAGIIAMGATSFDTWDERRKYKAQVEATEHDYFVRMAETSVEKAKEEADGVFGDAERVQIKKKLRNYRLVFITKVVFMLILATLLVAII